jgi:hypothetical protein
MAEIKVNASRSYDAFLEDCKDCNGQTDKAGVDEAGDGAIVHKGDDTPGLTASSSSEDSQPKAEDSQKALETACGTLQIARAAADENGSPASTDPCMKEAYDAAANTWTTASTKASGLADGVKEVYHAATNTWSFVSTKASGLVGVLGSAVKNPNLGEEMSEKAQELKITLSSRAQSFQESVITPTAKSIQATFEMLTTDTNAEPREEVMQSMSIKTESPTATEEKTPANLWMQIQNFIRNFKLPESISKFKLPESSTLFEDLKMQVPSILSSVCSPMEHKEKAEEAKEGGSNEVIKEVPPAVEVAPTLEASPTEELAPEISKVN